MEMGSIFLQLLVLLQVTYIKGQVGVHERNGGVSTSPNHGHTGVGGTGETFLDSLVGEGNDMTATFVLEALQGLHLRNVECSMNLSTVEVKHTKAMKNLIKYHRSMENLISMPKFTQFTRKDRPSVESNFHSTMKYMEKMRDQKLQKIKALCDTKQHEWLSERLLSMVVHANELIGKGKEQYQEMKARMQFCQEKMQQHLETCRGSTNSFGLLYCYVDELETLLRMIDQFLAAMQQIANLYFGDDEEELTVGNDEEELIIGNDEEELTVGDDEEESTVGDDEEELTIAGSAEGGDQDTVDGPDDDPNGDLSIDIDPSTEGNIIPDTTNPDFEVILKTDPELPSPSPTTTIVHEIQLPPKFFGPGPDTSTTETTPTKLTSDPTTQDGVEDNDDVTPASDDEVTPISSHPSPKSPAGISVTGSPAMEVTAEDSTTQMPHTQSTSQGRVFEEVLEKKAEREDSKSSSSSSSSSGSRKGKSKSHPGLGVDIEVQDDDVGVDINVGLNDNQGPTNENLFLDPASTSTNTENDENWNYTTYILIYFFLGLTIIILVFAIVVITMVTIWRARSRRRSMKYTPLILEREMLDVMKKTGYVNPTYTFYSQS